MSIKTKNLTTFNHQTNPVMLRYEASKILRYTTVLLRMTILNLFKKRHIFLFAFLLCLLPLPSKAQEITPDGTTATEVNSSDGSNFDINGGDKAGGNLFHSFGKFGVPTGGSANFLNSPDVENIINRVTGGNVSSIDGLLKANGGANLFLINPAGIVFGQNARLDLGGSFLGSTADSLLFNDGTEFSAVNATGKPLLTINAPIGLNFRDTPGDIVNQSRVNGNGLEVQPGKNITLVGGNINVDGGIIFAPGGGIELGGLAKAGEVRFNENGRLIFPDGVEKADVYLSKGGGISIFGQGGGFLRVNARNLEAREGSILGSGITQETNNPDAVAGDININATENVSLDGKSSFIFTSVFENAVGNAGNVNINTKNLSITNGATINTSTNGQGNSGNITIAVLDNVLIDGKETNKKRYTNISTGVSPGGVGNGGNIEILTNNFKVSNGANLGADTSGKGNGGIIKVEAKESVILDKGYINNQVLPGAEGNAGDIVITAKNISMLDDIDNKDLFLRSEIASGSTSKGNAGNIKLDAVENIFLNKATIDNSVLKGSLNESIFDGVGNSGNIEINAANISINNNSSVSTDNSGIGNSGNIVIKATNNFSATNNNLIISNIGKPDGELTEGNVGSVAIEAKNVSLTGTSQLQASFFSNSRGKSGTVSIKANDSIIFDGLNSGIFTDVRSGAIANGSDINLEANSISFTNGAALVASNFGDGNGGKISVSANNLKLDRSKISSRTESGTGGNIDLQITDLFSLKNKSQISARAIGTGQGGTININAPNGFVVATPNQDNDIVATAGGGFKSRGAERQRC